MSTERAWWIGRGGALREACGCGDDAGHWRDLSLARTKRDGVGRAASRAIGSAEVGVRVFVTM